VNISAGSDFSIGEFTAVGDLLDEFSSERSTVVIGTSIDPEMNDNDEVKVTVVAAGLGPDMGRAERPEEQVAAPIEERKPEPRVAAAAPAPVEAKQAAPAASSSSAPTDYTKLDRQPAINRKAQEAAAMKKQAESKSDMDYLDIPAFLRRQAD
jgi:cell division protein FtsZ